MIRTLCVDDTEASRYIFTRILREAGHEGSCQSEVAEFHNTRTLYWC